jgi:uncharacterized membrane protein
MSDWYYAANNEQKGPINESELKANFAANKLPVETLVWKDGMDNWTPANQVPAFTFRQPPAPAANQPIDSASSAKTVLLPTANPDSTTPVDLTSLLGTPEALEVDADDVEKNKIFGILAYLVFFVPLLATKDSPFAKYHANQGLVVFLLWLVILIAVKILDTVTGMLGLFILDWIFGLLFVVPFVLVVLGIINAAAGKCVPLPIVGGIKLLK